MIPKSVTKQVIDATDIVEVISEYVSLKKKGTSYFGLCPFHDDKNPSMSVSGEKKIFNCFSCGTKGNVIYFVAKHENITFDQATIKLAKRAGIAINEDFIQEDVKQGRFYKLMNEAYNFYHFYLLSSEEGKVALAYLHHRGINNEMIETYRIGLAPKANNYLNQALTKKEFTNLDQMELGLVRDYNDSVRDVFRGRIMFSIANSTGQIVGFSGRIYEENDQAKYINSTDNYIFHKGQLLYNYHLAAIQAQKLNKIYIFEGFMDVISVAKAGIKNAIATMGTALTKEHVKLITNLTKNIVLFFDGDEAGIKAMKRSAEMFSFQGIIPNAVLLPDGLDPDEYINQYGVNAFLDFVENNTKNVYLVLYNLAKKNVYPDDVVSLTTLKNEVYRLIKIAKNDIITNYLLECLSKDYNFDKMILKTETNDYAQNVIVDNPKSIVIPDRRKKIVKITPKVIMAYNTIIKFSVGSKDLFSSAFLVLSKDNLIRYPGSELLIQYDLIYFLSAFYSDNPQKEGIDEEELLISLKNKEQCLELAKEIMEDAFIDTRNIQLFKDSLTTIDEYFIKQDNAASYNAILFSENDIDKRRNENEFMILNKNQKKIVNEEDL